MRILHVMEATIGGTRRHLVDLARGEASLGHEVAVVASTLRDPDFPADLAELEAKGVRVRRLPMVREIAPRKDLACWRALKAILREERPDVVHTHSSKAGVLGRAASVATGIGARVHTPHTFAFLFRALFGPAKRALFRAIERRASRHTSRVIAVSPSEAETFRASGVVDPRRVAMVPNGIDVARLDGAEPLDLRELGLDPGRPVAATIGLVYAAKGQDLALAALAEPGLEDLQLLVVGPGETERLAREAAELGVARRVAITGPRRDVPRVLASVDALLLPSRWEGMPYVVLEAMAARLPVVATPVDGARDLVVDGVTGALAEGIDAASIARAAQRVLGAPREARERMGAAGRARVEAEFTLERMVERTLAVYADALRESSGARRREGAL